MSFYHLYNLTFGDKGVRLFRCSHLELVTWHFGNQIVSKDLKAQQVIVLDLNTSAKLLAVWIILKWYHVVDLILDSIWISLVFYCKFYAFKLFLFTLHIVVFFYAKINKANITIILLTFQVSKMDLTTFLGQLVSMLRVKLKKVIIRGKYVFKFRSNSSQNSQTFLRLWHFFSPSGYPFNSIFQ